MYNLKNRTIMKTLVISAIIAMTSLVNVVSAAAVNRTDNFAYNTETNDGRVETQTVFKVENQKFLHRHLKYNYIYDNSGRISQKEVLKWNESTQSFEKHHSLNFFYTDDVTVEYALWNEQSNAYTDIKQKAVYRQTNSSVLRYLSYEWDEKNNDWSLTADHHMTDESVQLLAEK
ncbi:MULTISPECIES: DUF3836 domain-containing protein [Bacteroides]|jgi:hypothetical protein|uniref:DUF3836 domain-containing protein n=2 Tax=Bacteroides uniformis TaxID=820 RepID=A0A3E4PZ62_BACUN|nr:MULTISPECIES: DUF3836 domain-containing protein [Bacteroides]MDC1811911.1 DUF3836 domain-containing protein [Bacteroides uniformis]RGJ07105.1 DUF3836 domain-containing protein [Bacteroides sp. D20]RGK85376.1 DUF3836 domain-containing protein [Bacteroides uniformis]RGS55971.1 DUF3836 domain-containing protein [Bacteroides uniformis]RJV04414.1 DUF3836 domain-containing protein [Bacteroides sp. AF34-31BH]